MHFLVSVKSITRKKRWVVVSDGMLARAPFFKASAIAQNVPFVAKYFLGTMNKIAKAERKELLAYEYLE